MNAKLIQRMQQTWTRRQADVIIGDLSQRLFKEFVTTNRQTPFVYTVNDEYKNEAISKLVIEFFKESGWDVTWDQAKVAYTIKFPESV